MKSKLLMPICIFVICQAMYDLFGVIQNTRWSIFYYSSQYIAWLALVVLLSNRPLLTKRNIPYAVLSIGIIIYIYQNVKCWNLTYKEFYLYVNEFKQIIMPITIFIAGLAFYIFKK